MSERKVVMLPNRGKGKDLQAYLREELQIPDHARWFTIRFAAGEPVVVTVEYLPVETKESA